MAEIVPSILSADIIELKSLLDEFKTSNIEWLHIDIMDGHFVPNLTFGPFIVKQISKITKLPLDAHLMVTNPDDFIEAFAEAGVQYITVHQESIYHLHRTIQNIKSFGLKAGVALNPATPVYMLNEIFDELDLILIMSVNPGFGGQKFIPSVIEKAKKLKELINKRNPNCLIEVDGGVNNKNIQELKDAGVDVVVAGSYVFGNSDYSKAIKSLQV